MAGSTFPLRFRHQHIRDLVRLVAEREGISQNELLEQAAEHEVVARGAMLAEELEAAAARLDAMTVAAHHSLVKASLDDFAHGESLSDPLRPRPFVREPDARSQTGYGAVAAFERSR